MITAVHLESMGAQCSCGPTDCNVQGFSTVQWRYYPCKNSAPAPFYSGQCGIGQTQVCAHLQGCNPPPSCDLSIINRRMWANLNVCYGAPNLAQGPYPLGKVLDLRTSEEKRAGCCWSHP